MKFLLGAIGMLSLWLANALAQQPLTSVEAFKTLSPEECRNRIPVQIEVTVTYPDPRGRGCFIHDGKTGTYLAAVKTMDTNDPIHFGDRLLINAFTDVGGYLPHLYYQSHKRLPAVGLPDPVLVTDQNLFSPALDCQWVRIQNALIVKIETREKWRLDFTLEIYGWTIPAYMAKSEASSAEATKLLYRHVSLEAVSGETFNRQRQMTGRIFFIPLHHLHPLPEPDAGVQPQLETSHHLLRCDTSVETPVRVHGVITHFTKENLFLRDKSGSLRVLAPGESEFHPGDEVEVDGVAAIAPFRPNLRARQIRLLSKNSSPLPVIWRKEIKDLSALQSELVQIQAEYLFCQDRREGKVLHCRTSAHFFDALLSISNSLPEDLTPGSRVQLTGIVQLTASYILPGPEEPDGFNLTLRTPADLVILSNPTWWTTRRLLIGMVLTVVLTLLASLWIVMLRRQVQAQTRQLTNQVEREATLNERQRIARDLHDTVQQQMTGLAIQLDNVVDRLDRKPELVRPTLNLARSMARYCREETGNAIRNLRCVTLETQGLEAALQEKLPSLTSEGSARLVFALAEKPVRFEAVAETYFLRIAQEAVSNAARHAQAKEITVSTLYSTTTVTLRIQDDGCGFDPQISSPLGHFGLSGMHERADKMNATLSLKSAPGKGTTVCVSVGLDGTTKS